MRIGRLSGNVQLTGGRGTAQASFSGRRGRLFDLPLKADIAPGRIVLTGGGTLDRKAIRLSRTAVLTRSEDAGWKHAPATISFAGRRKELPGQVGGRKRRNEEGLDRWT